MVAVPDVQATEAEQVQPSALPLQADDAQGFLVQGAIGFDALHEAESSLEVLIHIGLHAVEVPQQTAMYSPRAFLMALKKLPLIPILTALRQILN